MSRPEISSGAVNMPVTVICERGTCKGDRSANSGVEKFNLILIVRRDATNWRAHFDQIRTWLNRCRLTTACPMAVLSGLTNTSVGVDPHRSAVVFQSENLTVAKNAAGDGQMARNQGFAGRLKESRGERGFSKSELARRINVSPTAVWSWEEANAYPRPDALAKIAAALLTTTDFLETGDEPQEQRKQIKGSRLRVLVEPAYISALGLAIFAFAQLEWAAIWCCERIAPGSINNTLPRMAGDLADTLINLVADLPPSSEQVALCATAADFKELVRTRNALLHAKPGSADDGAQRLFRDGLAWTVEMIDDAADAFTACNGRLVALSNGFLASLNRNPHG
jgi:transcriptional regulator with XRE-family HTH domain